MDPVGRVRDADQLDSDFPQKKLDNGGNSGASDLGILQNGPSE